MESGGVLEEWKSGGVMVVKMAVKEKEKSREKNKDVERKHMGELIKKEGKKQTAHNMVQEEKGNGGKLQFGEN